MRSLWRLVVVGATIVALTVFVPSASAAEPVTVSMVGCYYFAGGTVTVPAGAAINIREGWGAKNRGLENVFLGAVTTDATLDGNPIAGSFGTPSGSKADGWVVYWEYPTVAPAAGHSIVVTVEWTLRHPVNDGLSGVSPAGSLGTLACTIWGE